MVLQVLAIDGTEIGKFVCFDGMKAKDLLAAISARYGLYGCLEEAGIGVAPAQPLSQDDVFTFVEDTAYFLEYTKVPSASTLSNSAEKMQKYLGKDEPMLNLCRTSSSEVPLPLVNEAFACYARDFNSRSLNQVDWKFVVGLVENMGTFFEDERSRQAEFTRHFEAYLFAALPTLTIRCRQSRQGQAEVDIRVEVLIDGKWVLVMMVEVKPELGLRGEPCVEAMSYFKAEGTGLRSCQNWAFLGTCFPVFIVELAGPTIRVGGAIFVETPCYEPFTPYLPMLKYLQDREYFNTLARALGSIGPAVASLSTFYASAKYDFQLQHGVQPMGQRSPVVPRSPEVAWPQYIRNEAAGGATVRQVTRSKSSQATPLQARELRKQNVGRQAQLLFLLTYPGTLKPPRLVKYCQRYGVEVHQMWSDQGYAPTFKWESLDGGWLLIDMEYFDQEDGWLPLSALDPRGFEPNAPEAYNRHRLMELEDWRLCKLAVWEAYNQVHADNPTHVHGDLRMDNILYNLNEEKVGFVDFDWAGIHEMDLYPPFLNPLILRPAGVKSCGIMSVDHDRLFLEMEIGP